MTFQQIEDEIGRQYRAAPGDGIHDRPVRIWLGQRAAAVWRNGAGPAYARGELPSYAMVPIYLADDDDDWCIRAEFHE